MLGKMKCKQVIGPHPAQWSVVCVIVLALSSSRIRESATLPSMNPYHSMAFVDWLPDSTECSKLALSSSWTPNVRH
jgi:hypothetical protein